MLFSIPVANMNAGSVLIRLGRPFGRPPRMPRNAATRHGANTAILSGVFEGWTVGPKRIRGRERAPTPGTRDEAPRHRKLLPSKPRTSQLAEPDYDSSAKKNPHPLHGKFRALHCRRIFVARAEQRPVRGLQ